ncbi:hypothetical protein [Lactococcus lactis]|uniref:hypothetical protein n=1 Tax=Lactococcus lactis TaxID=1358 RepID=UPI0024A7DB89|nr:hypothetical protein [Lactococcus lactis]
MTQQEIKSEDFQKLFSAILGQTDIKEYHKNLLTSHINILESLFDSYFRKFEGFSSSHDKSAYVVRKMMKSLTTGEVYSLSETYNIEKHPHMKKYEGEIAYWCPTSIKNTDEAIALVESVLNFKFEHFLNEANIVEKANLHTTEQMKEYTRECIRAALKEYVGPYSDKKASNIISKVVK